MKKDKKNALLGARVKRKLNSFIGGHLERKTVRKRFRKEKVCVKHRINLSRGEKVGWGGHR